MKISSLGNATAAVSQSVWESFIELQSRGEQLDTLGRFVYWPLVMVGRPKFYIGIAILPQASPSIETT